MRPHWRRWLATGTGVLAVLLCCFVAAAPQAGGGGPDRPSQLAVNLVSDPMTVPSAAGVRFTWVTSDAQAGERQRGYQLLVAASPAALTSGTSGPSGKSARTVWDSGTVTSSSPDASYAGRPLSDGTRYWWSVRTFDAQGRASQWSVPAQFGTALAATWDVLPVWARAPAGGRSSGWAFLRGSLKIDRKPIMAATVYATAASTEPARQYVFRLSLNGKVLGVGPVRPPDAATGTMYSAWNVTSDLRAGDDVFGALAYSAAHPEFQLELVVQYKDGTRQVWGTGTNWKAMDGGAVYPAAGSISPMYYAAPAENLDAERYPFGFDTAAYTPAAARGWSPAVIRPALAGLSPDPAANMELAAHKPVKITRLGQGRYLLDFGVTQVGGLRLTLDGTAGQQVRILSGEVLSSPGSVKYKLGTGDTYDDTWTLKPGEQTLQYWGYRTFRYVEVTGAPQALTTANTAALALVYPGQPGRSAVSTSSAALDQVWQFSSGSIEALNLSPYLDSPTRERSGDYMGDDYIHQLAQAAVDGDSSLAQYSLEYVLTSMSLGQGTQIIDYQELAPVAALDQYWQTGDPAVLTGLYSDLEQLLPTRYLGSDGLVSMPVNPFKGGKQVPGVPEQLVDWPASERDGFVFSRENTVVNAFAYAAYAAMAQIAGVLGDQAGAHQDAAIAARVKSAMRAKLYDPGTGAFRDGAGVAHEAVQSSVYAVALGVASPAEARTAAAVIARQGMACSVYCAAYLLEALYDGGQPQAALSLMTADTSTSWLHMISLGAGSTMEAWNTAVKPNLTYSHAWSASPAYIVPDYLFGVSALSPGWATVLIRPQPGSLASGSAQVPTPRGEVDVSFTSGSGGFTAEIDVPATATAAVALPGVRAGQRVWVDGTAVTAKALPAAELTAADDGTGAAGLAVVTVSSGPHRVSAAP
jgi:Bacterial alpha-L-rhamnosidase 6 hairpin glycosidase domain/Bacterial alpha-L-rhamnosidase C-terminal domain/Bacterial alpha-L-rhamnosidase concanavalin-like domain